MAQPIEVLTTPLTAAEVSTSIYQSLSIVGVNTTNWKRWSVLRTIITIFSLLIAALSVMVSLIAKSGFLSTAEGEWCELKAEQDYGVPRNLATFATTELLLSNSGGGEYHLDPGDLIVKNRLNDALYVNTEHVDILGLETDVPVNVEAQVAGSASSSFEGELTVLVTALPGLTCTNPAAAIGQDAESIPALRDRARESTGALSPNGPADAYSYIAKSLKRANGEPAGITRVLPVPTGDNFLDVYLASASGEVPAEDVTLADDAFNVYCVPLGITLRTHSATASPMAVTYTAWMPQIAGFTDDQARTAIAEKIAEFVTTEPIGGRLVGLDRGIWASKLEGIIAQAVSPQGQPLRIFRVAVSLPVTIFPMSAADVATVGAISGTIIQVP